MAPKMANSRPGATFFVATDGAEKDQPRAQCDVSTCQRQLMAKHQQGTDIADGHAQHLGAPDLAAKQNQAQQQHQRWREIQDEPLQRRGNKCETGKVEKARQVIAGKTQPQNAQPVAALERRFAPAGPPGHQRKQWQGKQHAVHDERDRIDAMAISQLDNDRLAAEGDGADDGQQQAGCTLSCCRWRWWRAT